MAAPIVAGEAALVRAAFPFLSNAKIAAHIEKQIVRMSGENPNKRIDVGKALTTAPEMELASTIQVGSSSYVIGEGPASVQVTVTRAGDLTAAATIDYATSDFAGTSDCNVLGGNASSRCDYLTTLGTLRFAPGETSKTILIPVVDDSYAEGSESFTVNLSNAAGANLGSPSLATVTINDNETVSGPNPIDQAGAFVRQQYIDFLNREPDTSGLAFWTNEITSCGSNQGCIEAKRVNVSAAFFLSIEFQETGYLVYRSYKAAYGNVANEPVPLTLAEFLPDTQQMGQGVVVGVGNWQAQLESNKQAFALNFVSRARFIAQYPTASSPAVFVDALYANTGVAPAAAERNAAINEFASAPTTTDAAARARVLRRVAENSTFAQQELNRAFVLTQYFGYLRRNPNDAPQPGLNFDGYDFWLNKLNQFNGNFVNAEMVKAFITSIEYRQRFAP
jgi:hypothetical protein